MRYPHSLLSGDRFASVRVSTGAPSASAACSKHHALPSAKTRPHSLPLSSGACAAGSIEQSAVISSQQ